MQPFCSALACPPLQTHHFSAALEVLCATASSPDSTMGARKGESALQKAERLQSQALQLHTKGQQQQIIAGMRQYLQHVPTIHDHFKRLLSKHGVNLDSIKVAGGKKGGDDDGADDQTGAKKRKLAICDGDGEAPDSDSGPVAETIRIQDLSVTKLVALMSAYEPVIFSRNELRSLQVRRMRQPPKESLLELIEFSTELNRASQVLAADEAFAEVVGTLRTLSDGCGRRAMHLRLPPSVGPRRRLLHRPQRRWEAYLHPPQVLEPHPPIPTPALEGHDLSLLYIGSNFSEDNASLALQGGMLEFKVSTLFTSCRAQAITFVSPSKPRRPGESSGSRSNGMATPSATSIASGHASVSAPIASGLGRRRSCRR